MRRTRSAARNLRRRAEFPVDRKYVAADAMSPSIGDYAAIGDCRTAALVSQSGAIEWLCLPHFSAPSIFAAILDRERGGSFSITPDCAHAVSRRYVGHTNVLETTFRTPEGIVRITDLLPMTASRHRLEPMREVLRIVEGVEGCVRLEIRVDPRPDYGRRQPVRKWQAALGWAWRWGNELLTLSSDVPLAASPVGASIEGRTKIAADVKRYFSLCYTQGDIGCVAPLGAAAELRREATVRSWSDWSVRARYEGPHRDAVIRSALVLKLMTYALSGAVIAAPTTSLPEVIGGARNWDYRYCWPRDAALTMRAFTGLGFMEEASAFLEWLLHSTRLTWPKLQVLYDVYGRTDLPEQEMRHWRGHAGSAPVRIGNAAARQLQLDSYGGVLYAALDYVRSGGELRADEARFLAGFGRSVLDLWQRPDHGMWEIRGGRHHYTMSKVWCWLALDCLLELERRRLVKIPVDSVRAARGAIANIIEARGFNEGISSYTMTLDGDKIDSSLLLMVCLGYQRPPAARMRQTYDLIQRRLARNGLLYRYETDVDRLTEREGAFGICSFWDVDYLVCSGEVAAAHRLFEHLLSFANDVGLFAEEILPDDGSPLGNFPQAFTHVGVIFSALGLANPEARRLSHA